MRTPDERIEELIAASVAGELSELESGELAQLTRVHPWIADEITRLRDVAERAGRAGIDWEDPVVTAALRERVLGEIAVEPSVEPRRRMPWGALLLGAACLTVGLGIGSALPGVLSAPPSGPPGTLGAYEPLIVTESAGIDVDADLVAHTWGTEAVLDLDGLTAGETYRVVFVGEDGTEFPAGEMRGSEVPIHCRLNAAVLREQTVRLEVRSEESAVIASADLPRV
ncbi:hypothetical protein [Microbacterium sp. 1.5R]|uniref:hypothetical protein n=1 Tax=Microbacterium sp. 1.5R TaxID=1916917 RepID=UPI0016427D1D|nr:hypothetical protein [Microbacterium sp. 1.5R]